MRELTSDNRIDEIVPMPSPADLCSEIPLDVAGAKLIAATRRSVSNILHSKDQRLLVVVGPCSIHDATAAVEYANRLSKLRIKYLDKLEIIMRVYFEKPRSTVGWKGLINDPDLNDTFNIDKGLRQARRLLIDITKLGLPVGCEFLDAATGQYYADTVSWGAIGARTTESQVHRELASGLSCPVGFKNGTSGDVGIAVDAIVAARHKHCFLSPTDQGSIALYKTKGNDDAHLILRGGEQPNYDVASVAHTVQLQKEAGIDCRIIVDCSHANSGKKHQQQAVVANDLSRRIAAGEKAIAGVMIESNLVEGKQTLSDINHLVYGQSVTDACIGWAETERVLSTLADSVGI